MMRPDLHTAAGEQSCSHRARTLGHVKALDGVRAIAVLVVLAFHTSILAPRARNLLPGGFLGVDVFFVLSGFLITALLLDEQRPRGRVRILAFYRRRALRLMPALVVALLASTGYAVWVGVSLQAQASGVLSTLLYVQNWANLRLGPHPAGTAGYWSLSIEEQFYLVWPFAMVYLLAFQRRIGVVAPILVAAIAAIAVDRYLVFTIYGWFPAYFRTDTHADGLLIGALAAQLWTRGLVPTRRLQLLAWICAGAFLVAVVLANGQDAWLYGGGFTLVAVATAIVVVALLEERSLLARVLEIAPLAAIGRVSYGAYLWHGLAYHVAFRLIPSAPFAARLMFGVGLACAATLLSWFFVERPFLARKRELDARDEDCARRLALAATAGV